MQELFKQIKFKKKPQKITNKQTKAEALILCEHLQAARESSESNPPQDIWGKEGDGKKAE